MGAGIGHGGIVVYDDTVDLVRPSPVRVRILRAVESCGKCTPCRIGSVRGKETMDAVIAARAEGRAAEDKLAIIR